MSKAPPNSTAGRRTFSIRDDADDSALSPIPAHPRTHAIGLSVHLGGCGYGVAPLVFRLVAVSDHVAFKLVERINKTAPIDEAQVGPVSRNCDVCCSCNQECTDEGGSGFQVLLYKDRKLNFQ